MRYTDWQHQFLNEILDITKGNSYRSVDLKPSTTALVTLKSFERGGGYRHDGLKAFTGEHKKEQIVHPGEIVIALTDVTQAAELIGRPARVPVPIGFEKLVASVDAGIVRPKSGKVDPRFLYYLLLSPELKAWTYAHTTGTTVLHLNPNAIMAFRTAIPPLHEQREIASTLGALDDKIELNRRMNATLEAMARALFQSWFVDFDPVRAKAEGRQPVGMDASTAALFPDSFADSALGPIPKGWAHTNLGSVAHVGSGKRPSTQYERRSASAAVPVYGGAGQTGWTDTALIDEPMILTGRVGTLGKVLRTEGPVWPSDNTLVIQPKALWINQLYFALQNVDLFSLNRGSSQPMLTQHDIRSQLIVAADLSVSHQFEALVSPLVEFQTMLNVNIERLAAVREALLPRLLSGELRVGDVAA